MPNNSLIGALRAEATLESGKFVDGAKKIRVEAEKTEGAVKSSFSGMAAAIKGFGGAVTAGLSIGVLAALSKKALDYAGALKNTSQQLGVTTRDLQAFYYAGSQNGLKAEQVRSGLEQLTVTLGKVAAGAKAPTAALEALQKGLSKDVQGKDAVTAFKMIADAMVPIKDRAQRAAVEVALFGEAGAKLDPMLSGGSVALDELSAAAERLGMVISDDAIARADETAQKLDDLKTVLSAQIAGVVAENADSILSLANSLATLTGEIVNFLGSNPALALSIIGGLAGSRFGLPGAAAGAVAGFYVGAGMEKGPTDKNAVDLINHNILAGQRKLAGMKPGAERDAQQASVDRLKQRYAAATGYSPTAPRRGANIAPFLAHTPKPRKAGGSHRQRRAPRDRSDDVEYQFDQEERRAEMDILRAKQDLAGTSAERTDLALKILDLEKQGEDAELANRVRRAERDKADGKITADTLEQVKAQAATLQAKNDEAFNLKRQAALQEAELHRMERADDLDQRAYDYRLDDLKFADEIAQTAAEHRRAQLEIVDVLYQQKEAHLRALKAQLEFAGKIEEAADVQAQIDRLPTDKARDQDRARRSTMGPWEQYASEIPNTADKMTAALEQVRVDGVEALTDSLLDAMTGVKSLGEAFSSVAKQIMADLLRIYIRKMLVGALSNALGAFGGMARPDFGPAAINIGASGSTTLSNFTPVASLPAFASGGSFHVLGNQGIDRNILSLNGLPIARVSHNEKINIANDDVNGGGAARVTIVPSQYFDAHVDGRAANVAAPMAGNAAMAGASGAMTGMQRRQARMIP